VLGVLSRSDYETREPQEISPVLGVVMADIFVAQFVFSFCALGHIPTWPQFQKLFISDFKLGECKGGVVDHEPSAYRVAFGNMQYSNSLVGP
jgi:hypothetical protein